MQVNGKKIAIAFIALVVIVEIIQVCVIIYIKKQPEKHLMKDVIVESRWI